MQLYQKSLKGIFIGLVVLIAALNGFISLYEFTIVGVLKQYGDYPFGGEGPVPWYYQSAETYSKIMLIVGLLFLASFLLAIYALIKKNNKVLFIDMIATLLLIVAGFINGQINCCL